MVDIIGKWMILSVLDPTNMVYLATLDMAGRFQFGHEALEQAWTNSHFN